MVVQMPRATCSHLQNDLLFKYPYNAQIYGMYGYGCVWRMEYSLSFGCFMHEWSWMPRAHLINDLLFEYPYNAQIYGMDGYGCVQRKNTLFYLDVLCMNGHGCLEQACSLLINDLLFEYPYNAQIYGMYGYGCVQRMEYSLSFGYFMHEWSWMPRANMLSSHK